LIEFLRNRWFFFIVFALSKASVFFAPLLLSNVLTKQNYGTFEYAVNLAFIGAAIVGLGVKSAYPYFILKRKYKSLRNGFKFHYVYLLFLNVLLLITVILWSNKTEYILTILFIYTLSNQGLISLIRKSNEKIVSAVIVDSLFYIALILAVIYSIISGNKSLTVVVTFSSLYALAYLIYALSCLGVLTHENYKKHNKLIKYGKNVLVSGLLILLIANSGRLLVEYFFNDKGLIAVFSFYFRMASFVLIFHQVVSILFFKKIYTFKLDKLDAFLFKFMALVALFAIISYFLVPLVGVYYFKLFETFEQYRMVYLIFCFQMYFWILLANNESVIYRENLAHKMNIGFIGLIFFFLILVFFTKDIFDFRQTVFLLYLLIVAAVAIQLTILYKFKKILLSKTLMCSALVFLSSIILIVIC